MAEENKFIKKENARNKKGHSAAGDMASDKKPKRTMMSMNVDPELYKQFRLITKKLSTNASAVLNEYMYKYVKEHEDLL